MRDDVLRQQEQIVWGKMSFKAGFHISHLQNFHEHNYAYTDPREAGSDVRGAIESMMPEAVLWPRQL